MKITLNQDKEIVKVIKRGAPAHRRLLPLPAQADTGYKMHV